MILPDLLVAGTQEHEVVQDPNEGQSPKVLSKVVGTLGLPGDALRWANHDEQETMPPWGYLAWLHSPIYGHPVQKTMFG